MQHGELRAKRSALEHLWRQGLSGRELLHRHSQLIDDYLGHCFARCRQAREGITLTALGGYGRRELFPFSDIDLLLLYEPEMEEKLEAVTEAILYPLWDAGLEVGHGVRTVEACLTDAGEDFFFQVALLDARLLAGDPLLLERLRAAYQKQFIEGHRQEFFQTMLQHRTQRHNRFGKHSYRLEPHIKESPGGFRDIQAMLWTAQVVFGLRDPAAMEEAGLLSPAERQAFTAARENLVQIRNRLHYVSGRKNDQLFFDHQEDMARAFHFYDSESLLGVERFMRDLYGQMHTVIATTDLFFEHVEESLSKPGKNSEYKLLEPGIAARAGRLQLVDPELLNRRPYLLMRLFAQAARTNLPLHYRTRRLITAKVELVTDRLRRSRRMAKAFFTALCEARQPVEVLSAMLETGLLVAYLPEFEAIRSLAQHDVYHVFTVDHHLLRTVGELHRLRDEEPAFLEVESPHVLYLAGLLHDIGKGHHHDHAQRGARLAKAIGKRLGLAAADLSCLVFLVEEHLFLTTTALRRDLEDEALIRQCAERIGEPGRLHLLYLLSLADARATGPTAWNDWKGALLQELYLKVLHQLERQGEAVAPLRRQGAEWMRERIAALIGNDQDRKLLAALPEEYLLSFKPEAIARHLALRARLPDGGCLVFSEEHDGFWSVFVMARDRTGLLAKICGVLALHNLEVVAAQIHTWADQTAADELQVRSTLDLAFPDQDWQALERDLNRALRNRLGLAHRLMDKQRQPSNLAASQRKICHQPRVVIDNEASTEYSVIEVFATDSPELLYNITRTLAEFAVNIFRAKIGSARDQVVDVFYVLDNQGGKIEQPRFQEELRQALLYAAQGGY